MIQHTNRKPESLYFHPLSQDPLVTFSGEPTCHHKRLMGRASVKVGQVHRRDSPNTSTRTPLALHASARPCLLHIMWQTALASGRWLLSETSTCATTKHRQEDFASSRVTRTAHAALG